MQPHQRSANYPSVAASGSTVHVAWDAVLPGVGLNVYYSRSLDNGATWDDGTGRLNESRLMSNTTNPGWGFAEVPQVAVNGSVAHLLYLTSHDGSFPIWVVYRRSADDGATWSEERHINDVDPYSSHPGRIAVVGDDVHIAWTENTYTDRWGGVESVYYRRSRDGGLSWGPIKKISNTAEPWAIDDVAATEKYVYITGTNDRTRDLYFWRSADAGETWDDGLGNVGVDRLIAVYDDLTLPISSSLAAQGEVLHNVVELDLKRLENGTFNRYTQLWYMRTGDGGANWTSTLLVDHTDVPYKWPGDPGCEASWNETWGYLGEDPCGHYATSPNVAAQGDEVGLVWADGRYASSNSTHTNGEIFYKASLDGGRSWDADVRLTDAPRGAGAPAIALEGSVKHVVWPDLRTWDPANDTTHQIFYKRYPANLPPAAPTMLSAVLDGPAFADVRLSWSRSPDDGAGEGDVVAYEVWTGETYDPTGASYALLASLPRGAESYVDAGAGVGNPANRYYQLRAVDAGNGTTNATAQAGKLARALAAGEHLLSVPLDQADWRLEAVLQTIPWSHARTCAEARWLSNIVGKTGASFAGLDLRTAAWVNVSADTLWVVAGLVPPSVRVPIHEGWNLVGYPSVVPRPVADVLAGVSVRAVEGWAPVAPYFLTALSGGDLLMPGSGYWVWARAPGAFSVAS